MLSVLFIMGFTIFTMNTAALADIKAEMQGVSDPKRAKLNYMLHCQGCHRPDGLGDTHSTPPLVDELGQFTTIPEGRAYIVRVPGVAMAPISDKALAELINWMMWQFDAPNLPEDFRPFGPEEVHKLRKSPLRSETSAVRSRLVGEIKAQSNR